MISRQVQDAGAINAVLLLLFSCGLVNSSVQSRIPCVHCHPVKPSVLTPEPVFPVEQSPYANCTTNFTQLEKALIETDNNRYDIIKAFYPPRKKPSIYVDVKYKFGDGDNQIIENWIWATTYFYFIQPPSLFVFTSLVFSYPTEQTQSLSLSLPAECSINESTTTSKCRQNPMLDVLTQRLQLYGKFNNLRDIVVVETPASAVCVQDVKDEFKTDDKLYAFFALMVFLPIAVVTLIYVIVKSLRTQIRLKLRKARNHANLAALALTGVVFSFYTLAMDLLALVHGYKGEHELFIKYNITLPSTTTFILVITIIDFIPTVIITFGIILFLCCSRYKDTFCWIKSCYKLCCCCLFPNHQELIDCEKELWILTLLFIAPLVCLASHAGYIVLAWICDHSHANSATFIILLSFFYYFFSFRQIYYCNCRCFCSNNIPSDVEACGAVYQEEQEEQEQLESITTKFNICRFTFELIIVAPVLATSEGFLLFAIGWLPVSSVAAASFIFQGLQLGLLILAVLITYKVLVTEDSPKHGLVRSIAATYGTLWRNKCNQALNNRNDLQLLLNPGPQGNSDTEVIGRLLGQMAFKYNVN